MAASGTINVPVKIKIDVRGGEEMDAFARALADAHREAKRLREQVRYLDRKLAILEDATYALLGIESTRQGKKKE